MSFDADLSAEQLSAAATDSSQQQPLPSGLLSVFTASLLLYGRRHGLGSIAGVARPSVRLSVMFLTQKGVVDGEKLQLA